MLAFSTVAGYLAERAWKAMRWELEPVEARLPPGRWVPSVRVVIEDGMLAVLDRHQQILFSGPVVGTPNLRPFTAPRHDSTSIIATLGWVLTVRCGAGCPRCHSQRPPHRLQ